jgi:hypothetical protein
MNEAWHVFKERDRRLTAPPHLEARVLAAIAADAARPAPRRRWRLRFVGAAAAAMAAAAVIAAILPPAGSGPPVIDSRSFAVVELRAAIEPHAPALQRPRRSAARPIDADWIAQYDELSMVLMMFEYMPALKTEPLQLVRLRVPREALQGLGVTLLEPDAGGTVDLDMLVGEDGLPRDIRRVRLAQEER